jgi:branched-subunit amino acid transport protein
MRASFIVTAHRLTTVPLWADRILRQIPPAALAALVLPALVRPEGEVDVTQPRLWVGLVAGFVAWRTRSVLLTLVVGLGGLMAVEALL